MIQRTLQVILEKQLKQFPIVTLTGPRQSGKTTLVKQIDSSLPYQTLEDPDIRQLAIDDPRGFLGNFPKGAILDEVQNAPKLFSYIQTKVDNDNSKFILLGSQNFQLIEKISQSLAGRSAILKLLPLSYNEITQVDQFDHYNEYLFRGAYPRLYDKQIAPNDFYPSYINTYIERDVRQIQNIENLNTFTRFIKLCAGRIGQPLNMRNLASDTGISPNTVKSWLSILEASYIIHFLQPHHKNFNKRLIKSPKLYFWDTGVLCSLLGIESSEQLQSHYLIGSLFENFIVTEMLKSRIHRGQNSNIYFWQNKSQKEIDIIEDRAGQLFPYEIKAGLTLNSSYFDNLKYWRKLTNDDSKPMKVIYGGDNGLSNKNGEFIGWKQFLQNQ